MKKLLHPLMRTCTTSCQVVFQDQVHVDVCSWCSNPPSYILSTFVVFRYNMLQNTVICQDEEKTTFLIVTRAISDHTLACGSTEKPDLTVENNYKDIHWR